jgi:hypothetical protein
MALRDFFLFSDVKDKFQEVVLRDREDLISEIRGFFDEIDKDILMAVSVS